MSRLRVVLLDVDGTLVQCAGAGRRSIERAVREHCALPTGDLGGLELDGSTDRLIIRHALALLERAFDDDTCDAVLARYVGLLDEELSAPGFHVLPGVAAALDALRRGGVPYGLCTGNVRDGARLKLRRGGLDGYFDWSDAAIGGFAADGEARDRVVLAAIARASARLGPVAPAQALVVGDTPRDIEAAHRVGCPVLAVATGRYRGAELAALGAEHVFESLEDPRALELMLG
jgi:phosphoglycolate phosphatase-like HAD superfamily hydrolase